MGLTVDHRVALQREGLIDIVDFADFKKTELKSAVKNARSGITGVPGFLPAAVIPAVPGKSAVPEVPEVLAVAEEVDVDGNITVQSEATILAIPARLEVPLVLARHAIPAVAPILGIPAALISAKSTTRLIVASAA